MLLSEELEGAQLVRRSFCFFAHFSFGSAKSDPRAPRIVVGEFKVLFSSPVLGESLASVNADREDAIPPGDSKTFG